MVSQTRGTTSRVNLGKAAEGILLWEGLFRFFVAGKAFVLCKVSTLAIDCGKKPASTRFCIARYVIVALTRYENPLPVALEVNGARVSITFFCSSSSSDPSSSPPNWKAESDVLSEIGDDGRRGGRSLMP